MRALSGLGCALLVAAAAQAEVSICTDRPTKANAVCTVPAGRVQVETSVAGWSLTRQGGIRSELLTLGSTTAKYGLSATSDLQIGFTPIARLTVRQDGDRQRLSAVGDVVIRYKRRLTADHSRVQVGIIPFVKLPTAKRGLDNRRVEGGIAVPVSVAAGKATVTFGPELDLLVDGDGDGHHLALVNLVNLGVPVANRMTLIGELWSNFNFDPAATVRQASADAAVAYSLSDNFQLDVGANIGLTSDTPDIEILAGASIRF